MLQTDRLKLTKMWIGLYPPPQQKKGGREVSFLAGHLSEAESDNLPLIKVLLWLKRQARI